MLGKQFSLMASAVKSCFSFQLREESENRQQLDPKSIFRDPAALPVLRQITDSLRNKGYVTTLPRPGKACHGGFAVKFSNVRVIVILLVSRSGQIVEFNLMTWPSQPFLHQLVGRAKHPDRFKEWSQVCATINDILTREIKPESLRWITFKQSEDAV